VAVEDSPKFLCAQRNKREDTPYMRGLFVTKRIAVAGDSVRQERTNRKQLELKPACVI
jgi:hypothetical protein